MQLLTYILILIILFVIIIDNYLRRKNKLAKTIDIEKFVDNTSFKKKGFTKSILIIIACFLMLNALFFGVNHQLYDGRLLDLDDGVSFLQNFTEESYNISDIEIVGDSIYKFEDNTKANGIIYCEYGTIGILKNGKPNGLWTLYHSNGVKKMRVRLVNGNQEGVRFDWYNDGSKEFEGNYFNDLQTGFSEFWYKNGQKELEGYFENGRFSGDYTRFYKNGSIKYIYNYQEKTFKEFWDNGNIYCEAKNSQLPNFPLNSITGYLMPLGRIPNESLVTVEFFDKVDGSLINSTFNNIKFNTRHINIYSGKDCFVTELSQRSYYVEDSENCDTYVYYPNGQVKQVNKGKSDYHYYEDGKLRSSWEKNIFSTSTKIFTRNGKIFSHFIDGEKSLKFDENGKENKNKLFNRKKELYFW